MADARRTVRRAPGTDSERDWRTLCEERRRFGCARPRFGEPEGVPVGRRCLERERRLRRTRRQRSERVAGCGFFGGLAPKVDEARAVDVLQRVNERRLPAGKQGRGEQQPRDQSAKIS